MSTAPATVVDGFVGAVDAALADPSLTGEELMGLVVLRRLEWGLTPAEAAEALGLAGKSQD